MSFFEVPIIGSAHGRGPKIAAQVRADPTSMDDPKKLNAELAIGKWAYEILQSHYRGHFWNVELIGGILKIGIPHLLGQWTYNMPVKDSSPIAVLRAGGEILERFKIPRSSIDVPAFVHARNTMRVARANQRPPV